MAVAVGAKTGMKRTPALGLGFGVGVGVGVAALLARAGPQAQSKNKPAKHNKTIENLANFILKFNPEI